MAVKLGIVAGGGELPARLVEVCRASGREIFVLAFEGQTEPAAVEVLHAPGLQAEVREVAERIRARIDAGAEPERIAVVARDLAPYALPLRRHFRRLGVPFSGLGVQGPPGPAGRSSESKPWKTSHRGRSWSFSSAGLTTRSSSSSGLVSAEVSSLLLSRSLSFKDTAVLRW